MKALILSSGGVDSTTCISLAIDKYGKDNVSTLSVFYGQKNEIELSCARKIAEYFDIPHYEYDLSPLLKFSRSSLLAHSGEEIAHKSYAEQIEESGRVATYVPFRNGLLLSAATVLAQSLYPREKAKILYGAHKDDAAGEAYPDCSSEFAEAIGEAINIGTYKDVTLEAPFVDMTKADVVALGLKLKTPYELTRSCYESEDKPCGKCGTCIDRAKAFALNGVKDPATEE